MIRRIRGLIVIIRAIFPILLVVALALATWWTAGAIVDATRDYGENLSEQLDGVREAVTEANEGLEQIGGYVASAADAANSLYERVENLADSITIPLPEVEIPPIEIPVIDYTIDFPDFRLGTGDLNIPIPGVKALKSLADDLAEAGRKVTEPVAKVGALADVPPHLEEAARDTADYAGEVKTTMSWWLKAVLLLLAIGALAWLIAQAKPMLDEIGRGWKMLRGHPAPERALPRLEQRVKDLEKQVARLT